MAEFQAYLEPLIARRRTDPGPDLISLLVAPSAGGARPRRARRRVRDAPVRRARDHRQPHRQRAPRAPRAPAGARGISGGAPEARPAVEELLRFDSPVQRNRRRTTRDTELAGRPDPGRRPRPRVPRLREPRRARLRPARRARSRAGPGQAPRVRLRHPLLHRRGALAAGGAARPRPRSSSASRRSAWRRTPRRCGSRTSHSGGSPSSSCSSDAAAGGRRLGRHGRTHCQQSPPAPEHPRAGLGHGSTPSASTARNASARSGGARRPTSAGSRPLRFSRKYSASRHPRVIPGK